MTKFFNPLLDFCSGLCRAYGVLSLGRNLSPMPQPRQKHALVTTGERPGMLAGVWQLERIDQSGCRCRSLFTYKLHSTGGASRASRIWWRGTDTAVDNLALHLLLYLFYYTFYYITMRASMSLPQGTSPHRVEACSSHGFHIELGQVPGCQMLMPVLLSHQRFLL